MNLKILTYNILAPKWAKSEYYQKETQLDYSRRMDNILDFIADHDPDIMFLQEVQYVCDLKSNTHNIFKMPEEDKNRPCKLVMIKKEFKNVSQNCNIVSIDNKIYLTSMHL
jgi:endonuclease/exonuclease/phosphatase family metal-dependent hydrolase